jgi:hypothetical protein
VRLAVVGHLRQNPQPQACNDQPFQKPGLGARDDHLQTHLARLRRVSAVAVNVAGQEVEQPLAIQRQHPFAQVVAYPGQTRGGRAAEADAVFDAAANLAPP